MTVVTRRIMVLPGVSFVIHACARLFRICQLFRFAEFPSVISDYSNYDNHEMCTTA